MNTISKFLLSGKNLLVFVVLGLFSFYYYERYLGTVPDYYYRAVIKIEVSGKPLTLDFMQACKVYQSRRFGGGGYSAAKSTPANFVIRLQNGRGLAPSVNACMWPAFRSRYIDNHQDVAVGEWWKDNPRLEGVIPLILYDSFAKRDEGDFYLYETGYTSPGSEIKYISGVVEMSDKPSYLRWLANAEARPDQIYLKHGYNFWSLDPHYYARKDEEESQRGLETKRYRGSIGCFALIKLPEDYLRDKMSSQMRSWLAKATEGEPRVVPREEGMFMGHLQEWEAYRYTGRNSEGNDYGIMPYGFAHLKDNYFYLDFNSDSLTLKLDESRRGILRCATPPNPKIYQNYDFNILIGGHFLPASDGTTIEYKGNLYIVNIGYNSPQ